MTKKLVKEEIDEISLDFFECTLGTLLKNINELVETFGEDVELENRHYDDCPALYLIRRRPETESEYKYRLEREAYYKEAVEKHEREQYEALKKKYGESA